ncbi:Uncharacterised protein [Vibrio cholerae]|nr:Uncharacterised protein [Vibrio cholerae]
MSGDVTNPLLTRVFVRLVFGHLLNHSIAHQLTPEP